MGIADDRDFAAPLGLLVGEIRGALDGSLAGLYLYGSLAAGDFDPERSDIDLVAVVHFDVAGEAFDRLDGMHGRFVREHPAWRDRIEVAYVSTGVLRNFKEETGNIAVVSPGEPFNVKVADSGWLMNWYMVREAGLTLYGPPPRAFVPEISEAEFGDAVRENTRKWPEWVHGMRHPGARSYVVLTMCRALYTLVNGGQASKKQAAAWARRYLPAWEPLIRWAWDQRTGALGHSDEEPDFSEIVRFVYHVRDLVS